MLWSFANWINPRTDGGLGQLRTDGGGGSVYPPFPQRSPKQCVLARIQKSVRKISSSSTVFMKVILRSGQYWGHQRSSKIKFTEFHTKFSEMCYYLSILVRGPGKKHSIALELFFRWHGIRLELLSTVCALGIKNKIAVLANKTFFCKWLLN